MGKMTNMPEFFDTRPQAVDAWLENLPIAHIGETARQLYAGMRKTNYLDNLSVKHHFHLLEGIAEPLSLILPELHRHYAGKPLPLSNKRRKVADLYTQLLRQSIIGYQQVIAHSIELSRFGWKKVVTTSVHRIFYYSGLMICNYRLLHMPYQKGMWQQLYWLYQLVENYNLLNCKIKCLDEPSRKSTIATEFKRLLLLSLLSPNLFKQSELQEVHDNMDVWIQHATLSKSHKQDQHCYAFTLEADIAPGLVGDSIPSPENSFIEVRYLNITDLLQFINRVLTNAKSGVDIIKLARNRYASRRSLLILLNNWGRPTSRDGERRLIQGQAEVAIGVSAIHYVVSEGRHTPKPAIEEKPAPATAAEKFSMTIDPVNTNSKPGEFGFTAERDEDADIWDAIYYDPEPSPPSWTESIQMKVYSYLNAKVLNISKGGFCVALPQDRIEHIQSSELVAIRGKQGQWQLGEIRWMVCPTSGPIRAGIKKLSQKIGTAQLHIQTEAAQTLPINCLVGQNETGHVLFLPRLPTSVEGKNMLLEINGEMRNFNLIEQLYSTPVGTAYYFEWAKTENTATDKSDAASSEYESIWASL